MEETSKKKSAIDQLPPRFAFWAGVVVAAAVFAIIGFIIMITLVVKGVDLGDGGSSAKTNRADVADDAAAPAVVAPTADAIPTGVIDPESLTNVQGAGDITIVEYSDMECPFCSRFHPTLQQVVAEYDGQVRWAYKHFPLTSIHQSAQKAAEASECAAEQGGFWEFTDYIFANQATLGSGAIQAGAEAASLDLTDFNDCLDSGKYTSVVNADAAEAQGFGGRGTPFSIIIDKDGNILDTISGALDAATVSAQLDTHLN